METFPLTKTDVVRIDTLQAMYLQKGDIALVRSANVPSLGDHFIVVTGGPVQKPHGIRPETMSICNGQNHPLLDEYDNYNGVVALKLLPHKKIDFRNYIRTQINH